MPIPMSTGPEPGPSEFTPYPYPPMPSSAASNSVAATPATGTASAVTVERPNFEGLDPRRCAEHRTVGPHRAWCGDCREWCYPDDPCRGCQPEPAPLPTRAEVLHTAELAALGALNEHLPASKRYDADGITKVCACGLESDGGTLTARTRHLAEVSARAVAEQLQGLGLLPWREET